MKILIISLTLTFPAFVRPLLSQASEITILSSSIPVKNEIRKTPESAQDSIKEDLNEDEFQRENYLILLAENKKLIDSGYIHIVRTTDGKIYTATKKGIKMWDGSSTILITTENSDLPENCITGLGVDEHDCLWIGTAHSGLVKGIGKDVKPFKIKSIQTHDQNITSIYMGKHGLVLVTFRNGGFECFKDGVSHDYYSSN